MYKRLFFRIYTILKIKEGRCNMVDLTGMKVTHKAFGEGTVKDCTGSRITVSFDDKERKFNFPDVFEKFLKAEDDNAENEIKDMLTERTAKLQALKQEEYENFSNNRKIRAKLL